MMNEQRERGSLFGFSLYPILDAEFHSFIFVSSRIYWWSKYFESEEEGH